MTEERRQRQERHLQMLREHLILECKDDIVEYRQKRDEARTRGREDERAMYESFLAESEKRLRWVEAEQQAA